MNHLGESNHMHTLAVLLTDFEVKVVTHIQSSAPDSSQLFSTCTVYLEYFRTGFPLTSNGREEYMQHSYSDCVGLNYAALTFLAFSGTEGLGWKHRSGGGKCSDCLPYLEDKAPGATCSVNKHTHPRTDKPCVSFSCTCTN